MSLDELGLLDVREKFLLKRAAAYAMSFSPIHSRSPVRRGPSPAGAEDDRSNINTIFVGNLAPDSDERSLREFFGKYGYVTQVKVGIVASFACVRLCSMFFFLSL